MIWGLTRISVLLANAAAILNRQRFLAKHRLDNVDPADPSSVRSQVAGLLTATSYIKPALVVANAIVIVVDILFA